jgi:hypothetical protein
MLAANSGPGISKGPFGAFDSDPPLVQGKGGCAVPVEY